MAGIPVVIDPDTNLMLFTWCLISWGEEHRNNFRKWRSSPQQVRIRFLIRAQPKGALLEMIPTDLSQLEALDNIVAKMSDGEKQRIDEMASVFFQHHFSGATGVSVETVGDFECKTA